MRICLVTQTVTRLGVVDLSKVTSSYMKYVISTNMKRIRKEKNISQSDVEELSGVSKYEISHIECKRRLPDIVTLKKISLGLRVSMSELLKDILLT